MKSRNIFAFVFAMVILLIGVTPVDAIKTAPRSTGQFTLEVTEGKLVRTDRTFALEKGEEVTIKASYTPFDANVDVGILNSATGTFYYQSTSDGTVDVTITVAKRGNYYLAIRNNFDDTISITGYVKY